MFLGFTLFQYFLPHFQSHLCIRTKHCGVDRLSIVGYEHLRIRSFRLSSLFSAGIGGSAPIAIGGGVIGDLFSIEDRATAMSVFTLGPLIGPSVGPIAGGFIAQTIGFKWVFIVIAIFSAAGGICGIIFFRETYAPVIQLHRAQKQRAADPETFVLEHSLLLDERQDAKHVLWVNLSRPVALLFGSFVCLILSLYMGL